MAVGDAADRPVPQPAGRTRRPLIGAGWKMHLTSTEAAAYLRALRPLVADVGDRDLFVLPAFPALWVCRAALAGSNLEWGAQDVSPDDAGAHTGDVSAEMLVDLGCRYVEVGHAERRRDHGETADLVAAKVAAALRWGLSPIACVGEARRASPVTALATILPDLEACLALVPDDAWARVVIAYEPVWAIGGPSAAPVDDVAAVHLGIRSWLDSRAPGGTAARVIYGGSVDESTTPGLLAAEAVDGLFVGRRALDPEAFARIARTPIPGAGEGLSPAPAPPGAIAIGSDDAGYGLKTYLLEVLRAEGREVADLGCDSEAAVDYPDVALAVAHAVARGEYSRGILVCGTGIGMAITANKVPGIRAAQAHDPYSAERARMSNDAQILALGARVLGRELAASLVRTWLGAEFAGGASARKIAKIMAAEGASGPAAPGTGSEGRT